MMVRSAVDLQSQTVPEAEPWCLPKARLSLGVCLKWCLLQPSYGDPLHGEWPLGDV